MSSSQRRPSPQRPAAGDPAAVAKVTNLNKKALDAYGQQDYDTARDLLKQALEVCDSAGLDQHPITARTHIHFGVVAIVGFKQREVGLKQFKKALEIEPDIKLTKSLVTPELQDAFEEAVLAGDTNKAGGAAAAAGGDDNGGNAGGAAAAGGDDNSGNAAAGSDDDETPQPQAEAARRRSRRRRRRRQQQGQGRRRGRPKRDPLPRPDHRLERRHRQRQRAHGPDAQLCGARLRGRASSDKSSRKSATS